MAKTTIELDQQLLRDAQEALGTRGLKATVERALEEVVIRERRRQAIEQLRTLDGLDLDKPEVMTQAWK